ncbi:hypothetical protein V6N13_048243 [Hibiscus sabdariffa]
MFSYHLQVTDSHPIINIHDTHASLVSGLPVGRPPVVDPLEATMMEADSDLIMPVTVGKRTAGDPDLAKNNQLVQSLSFKDTLLGKSMSAASKGVEELDVEVGADDVRIAMDGLVPEIHFSDKEVCSYAQSSQATVDAHVDYVADDVVAVESHQAANALYGPWMLISRRRRRAIRNKRVPNENGARSDRDTQALGSRFAALQDQMPNTRGRQASGVGGILDISSKKLVDTQPITSVSGPGECSIGASQVRAVGVLYEVQTRVKKGIHKAI